MSKKLIAGAGVVASLAVALAPLATYATMSASDQHTDQLVLTVLPSCTFGSWQKGTAPYPGGITHDAGADTNATNYAAGYGADGDASTAATITATSWNTTGGTAETTGTNHTVGGTGASAGEVDHNNADVASTGYGILDGEGGLTLINHSNLANASEHTVHRSMLAGTTTDTFAQTTMNVVCNNRGGYSISVTASALTNGTAGEDIPVSANYSTTASGYALKAVSSASAGTAMDLTDDGGTTWSSTGAVADVAPTADTETLLAKHSGVSDEAGDSITVTYGVGVAGSQKADTYAGTVVYKLYKGLNGADDNA